jgi:hypothetical protein
MLRSCYRISTLVLLTVLAGCGGSETAENSGGSEPIAQNSESSTPMESAVLKQEMVDLTLELMKAEKPDADPKDASGQVEQGIAALRKMDPDFLMVSAETEKKLEAGEPIEDASQRIDDAEKFINEFDAGLPGLAKLLLAEYKAGKLSPARTELLAQLLTAERKKIEAAVSE